MSARVAVTWCLLVVVLGACTTADRGPDDDGGATGGDAIEQQAPPDAQPVAVERTAVGEAGVRLEVGPERIEPDEDVRIRLHNVGEVELLTGLDYVIERWDGSTWVQVFTPEVPAVGLGLGPGQSTPVGEIPDWPGQFRREVTPEPGNYRVTKTASVEGDAITTLSVDATFEVVAGS